MAFFDVSRDWVILAPQNKAARTAAAELSRYIALLRKQAELNQKPPAIKDADGPAPEDSVPVIILNSDNGSAARNGFTWRLGRDRLEFYGNSDRGLCNGVFDFLAALEIRWPERGREELPPPPAAGAYKLKLSDACSYPLREDRAHVPSEPAAEPGGRGSTPDTALKNRRRLVVQGPVKPHDLDALIQWAARNRIDALVFSLREKSLWEKFLKKPRRHWVFETAEKYSLAIEWGGWDLSFLAPRGYFFFHRELFRMDSGKRVKQYNFCPTNHETIILLKKQAAAIFREAAAIFREAASAAAPERVYHLWPDRGEERTWCSCPACRAFSPEEQNRIAVNAAADVLAEIDPHARLSWYEAPSDSPESEIPLRGNLFRLTELPEIVSL
ncbi:hypothetical protein AGMMS49587_12490 [Spirochaetia bacterium]|nr:hypothetical protein AGMMS49587_12490 [Spirochaetia bacterium]